MAPVGLAEFLSALGRRRRKWGETDCLTILADWVHASHGVDPGAPWRGTYSDEAGAMAIMEREGGMIALIDKALAPLGIGRTRETVAGNVCVVRAPIVRDGKIERGAEAALCISPELRAVHAVDGVVIAPMPVLVAWAV